MRKFACLMGMLLFVSLSASAQDNSKIDIFGGYSYLRFNPGAGLQSINFNGGVGSVSYNIMDHVGIVGEIGGYHNGNVQGSGNSVNVISYLFGPKVYMHSGKITPFGQVLFGGARASCSNCGPNSQSYNDFAMALGGGVDWNATHHIAVRLGQVEYVYTRFPVASFGGNTSQNNFRYSAGVVIKF